MTQQISRLTVPVCLCPKCSCLTDSIQRDLTPCRYPEPRRVASLHAVQAFKHSCTGIGRLLGHLAARFAGVQAHFFMFSKRKSIFLGLLADTPGMAIGGAAKAGFKQSRASAGAVMNSLFWPRR